MLRVHNDGLVMNELSKLIGSVSVNIKNKRLASSFAGRLCLRQFQSIVLSNSAEVFLMRKSVLDFGKTVSGEGIKPFQRSCRHWNSV